MVSSEENQGKIKGKVFSLNLSIKKGAPRETIEKSNLIENFGLADDVRAGPGARQVSLLAIESIRKQAECPKVKRENPFFGPGDFAENITTEGLNLRQLNIGDKLKIGTQIILEISKIGKECHKYCAIYQKDADCIIPREGIFAKVLRGGEVAIGGEIEVVKLSEKTGVFH